MQDCFMSRVQVISRSNVVHANGSVNLPYLHSVAISSKSSVMGLSRLVIIVKVDLCGNTD